MNCVHLLPHLGNLTRPTAERWIAAGAAEAAVLHDFDDRLYPLGNDPSQLEEANRLHDEWQRWADDAEAIINRVRAAPSLKGQHLQGLFDLNMEVAFARGLAAMPPEEIQKRHQSIQAGEGHRYASVGDLRRELGLASKS